MKKILLINYYWPPSGGSAVQRWLDITSNFERLGITSFVVSIREDVATYPFRDLSLNDRIASSTQVYKTDSKELFHLYDQWMGKKKNKTSESKDPKENNSFANKIARFIRGNFFIPDPRKGWNSEAFKQAKTLMQQHQFDAVFTAGPPQSTHLIGLKLKKQFPNIKWIADFHDYWTDIFILKSFYRTAIAQHFDKKLEKKVLQEADYIMTHCQSAARLYNKKVPDIDSKTIVHTMGFNGELFTDKSYLQQEQKEFSIVYTGILGANYNPFPFLETIHSILQQEPELPLKLKFAGALFPAFFEKIKSLGLEKHFDFLGYIPQQAAIDLMKSASALLLINPKIHRDGIIVPGKIYEYLAIQKPIISISSPGSENELIISKVSAGANFDWSDTQGLKNYLLQLIRDWKVQKNIDLPTHPGIQKYERAQEAGVLAKKIGLK